eukprot:SM000115S23925  [mRNA]  locus=s115:279950:284412:- [translate_table: standard]
MLELLRAASHQVDWFWRATDGNDNGCHNAVIFLFNTGEEEGLLGSHAFVTQVRARKVFYLSSTASSSTSTQPFPVPRCSCGCGLAMAQHPWRHVIKAAIDLEAMGVGGRSAIFQAGPSSWLIKKFQEVAPHPTALLPAQDIFISGVIKSATDFQVYQDVAGLSGLDFAYMDHGGVYHTKNDRVENLAPGSLQHLGNNMHALVAVVVASSDLGNQTRTTGTAQSSNEAIYFDLLGQHIVTFPTARAVTFYSLLRTSALALLLTLVPWLQSIVTIACTGLLSLAAASLVAVLLPLLIPASPAPYIAHPWLVLPLFVAPALAGALLGHSAAHKINLHLHGRARTPRGPSEDVYTQVKAAVNAERTEYLSGLWLWLAVLMAGTFAKVGTTYLAVPWLVCPTLSFVLIEGRRRQPLLWLTTMVGVALPIVLSSEVIIRLPAVLIGTLVRSDSVPGKSPLWLGNVTIAVLLATYTCLTLIFLLPYAHRLGASVTLVAFCGLALAFGLLVTWTGIVPPYTPELGRTVNVVQVHTARVGPGMTAAGSWQLSLASGTPGLLTREASLLNDSAFACGRDGNADFVTYAVEYGCTKALAVPSNSAHLASLEPELVYMGHQSGEGKNEDGALWTSLVGIRTAASHRWQLAMDASRISSFSLRWDDVNDPAAVLAEGPATGGANDWHIIQFVNGEIEAGGSFARLLIGLEWKGRPRAAGRPLLKLRADYNHVTEEVADVLQKLPAWCCEFGKSTSPYNLAFVVELDI